MRKVMNYMEIPEYIKLMIIPLIVSLVSLIT